MDTPRSDRLLSTRSGNNSWRPTRPGKAVKRRRAATDEVKLFGMGYKQELERSFTFFNNAGVSFSVLSPLAALTGTYGTWGLRYGGPVVMMWGLPLVAAFSLCVAVSLAELTSAYPTSGAVYYWSFALAPPRHKALLCWLSGWVLVLGQLAFTAANTRIFVDLLRVVVLMGSGHNLSTGGQVGIYLAVLGLCAAAASAPNRVMAYLTSLAAFWNAVALAALVVALPLVAPRRRPASYIFLRWEDSGEATGVRNGVQTALIGLMMSQYLFLGFDASAHVCEETRHAEINAPRGMLAAAGGTAVGGYVYLLSLNASSPDPRALLDPNSVTRGQHAVAQLMWDVHRAAFGDGRGAVALLSIPLLAALLCCHQSVANNARMLFAFSRDGAVPFSRLLCRVQPSTKVPTAAVWAFAALSALIGLVQFYAAPAVGIMEQMAVINIYLAYGVPICCKLLRHRSAFLPGPFYTGARLSRLINSLAVAWIAFLAAIFSLPTLHPVTPRNMNYSSAGTLLVVLSSLAAYYCPYLGGRHWFSGPRPNLGQFDDASPLARQQQLLQRQLDQQGQQRPRLSAWQEEQVAAMAEQQQAVLEQQRLESEGAALEGQGAAAQAVLAARSSGGARSLLPPLAAPAPAAVALHWRHRAAAAATRDAGGAL